MSTSINIKAYSSKNNKEFQRHYNVVMCCIENSVSFPKETSEFFKGKVDDGDLEDYTPQYLLDYISNGVEVPLKIYSASPNDERTIKVSEIPKEVDIIVIKLS